MYFIGIDQSIVNTGWCVLADTYCVSVGNIKPKDLRGPERLTYISDAIGDLLLSFAPVFGALESGSYASDGRLFQLGGVHALVQVQLWTSGIPLVDVAPVQLKKFMTGKSGATKKWMLDAAKHITGIETMDDNVADAIGLACIARAVHTQSVRTRAEAEVLNKLNTSGAIYRPEV